MDTSREYIKQCEKAEEIQISHELEETDYYAQYEKVGGHSVPEYQMWRTYTYCDEYNIDEQEGKVIWLPHQGQLQEMIGEFINDELGLVNSDETHRHGIISAFVAFKCWLNEQYHNEPFVCVPTNCFNSGEQLWLAFLLAEKYGKYWDGSDWVLKKSGQAQNGNKKNTPPIQNLNHLDEGSNGGMNAVI